jgi:anti-sigma factor RsiW
MTHPDEQELVMYVLGDGDDRGRVRGHLAECAGCRAAEAELKQLLSATARLTVPEPDAGFEARIWERQRQHLGVAADVESAPVAAPSSPAVVIPFWSMQRLLSVGAVAAMLLVAFMVGLYNAPPGTEIVPEGSVPRPDRILFVAVGDHLESARMVLVELVNADDADTVDISMQQQRAQALLANNRLYRQTAQLSGQTAVADVLTDLERVLLEVARTSGQVPAEELDWLRERIAAGDLLFKVNVIEGQTRRAASADAGGETL